MTKNVLDIGNCRPDHAAIRSLIESSFDAKVLQAHGWDDTLAALESGEFDLILVNRRLDRDGSDGLEIIRRVKAHARLAAVPVMMITNYPDFQQAAGAAGAEPGFGKADLGQPGTLQQLAPFLGCADTSA